MIGILQGSESLQLVWRRRSPEDMAVAAYDDDAVVYHRPSGITHLLNAPTLTLLDDVLAAPATFEEIAAAFRSGNEAVDDAEFNDQLFEMLLRLEHFGFVDRELEATD